MNQNEEEMYLSASEEKDLFSYNEWVAILLQDFDPYRYQDKYEKFMNKYQQDNIFQQIVWVVLKLDKNKNTFNELISAAIPGKKTINIEAPIEKMQKQAPLYSKKIIKLQRKLQSYNVQFDFEEQYPLPQITKPQKCHKQKSIKFREKSIQLMMELLHDITRNLDQKNEIEVQKHFYLVTILNELDYINDDEIFLKAIARVRICL